MNENDIQNRYRPIIKEFFGKKDYKKCESKSEKFMRPEELKMLYRDTRLINSIFDYLNNSFSKIRYHQAMINQKEMNELLKKKNEKNFCNKLDKEKDLPLNDIIQIKKIIHLLAQESTLCAKHQHKCWHSTRSQESCYKRY